LPQNHFPEVREYAIIVAGGTGTRMGSGTPKQFIPLMGKPILMHTVEVFHSYSPECTLIVVLPENQILHWEELCRKHGFRINHRVVRGGSSRFQSVKNGLALVEEENSLVAIHDGVRPLVRIEIISASFRLAELHGSAIAAVRLKESIRVTNKDGTRAMDRSSFRLIQTPQSFQFKLIRNAYELEETSDLTDDASVAEKMGVRISLFEGSYENIKITTPEDLILAEALLKHRRQLKR
jgi:2-C-methyl-D-erythritol 4-phosphate cytidylyltransferase